MHQVSLLKLIMEILWEDESILVVNKPPGLPVHATLDTKRQNVLSLLKSKSKDLTLIHRLDSLTSGVLLLAKTKSAALHLQKQLMNHEMQKTYWAIVLGHPPNEARFEDFLKEKKIKNKTIMSVVKSGGKKAILDFRLMDEFDHCSLVEIQLLTGRMHQIRVQFSNRGFPLKGDALYGAETPPLFLHARKLEFTHPTTLEKVKFTAFLPEYFKDYLKDPME